MSSKQVKYTGLLLVLILLIVLRLFNRTHSNKSLGYNEQPKPANYENRQTQEVVPSSDNNIDFDRNVNHIIYSHHARCRMDCRHIDEAEVKEVLAHGIVNKRKIEKDSRGKTYPLEETVSGHRLRIVFAPKGKDAVEVVTCIDLDTEWQCDCH